ncbi:MAG: hypothetical protein OXK77_00055 [Gemmatimonadota bacterium]|nr:hypothetical protein [Gemmatimonadota bacterium]
MVRFRTSTAAVAARDSQRAVTRVEPAATAVTRPAVSIDAIEGYPLDQATLGPRTGRPFESTTVAERVAVSPIAESVSSGGSTRIESATCDTVTAAVPVADPAVAVIDAVPLATAVTRPLASTVATAGAADVQPTVTLDMVLPFWSLTSALNRRVWPRDSSVAEEGVTVTLVGTGVGGGGGGGMVGTPESPEHAARSTTGSLAHHLAADPQPSW